MLLALGVVATAKAFTFELNKDTGLPVKWPAGTIKLKIMLGDTTPLIDGSNFNTSARTAANAWNTVLGSAQFQTELAAVGPATEQSALTPPQPVINELVFAANVFGKDFGTGVLAVTSGYSRGNERTEADITFNSASYQWDSYRGVRRSGIVDLQRVAIHELGHVLGLDHPDDKNQFVTAIMNSHVGNLDALATDDIDGAQSLYGPPDVPANDNFANARVITLNGAKSATDTGFNTKATKETNEPSHADDGGSNPKPNPGGRSVWWKWTAPSAGNVTIDTRGSYFDTMLGVYTGNAFSNLTRVASNDDINPGVIQASTVTFKTISTTTYLIAVDGFNNDDGNGADSGGLTLNLAFDGDLGTAPAITTQPVSVTVNSGGSASFSVVATGTDPLSYQWLFNSTAITGATTATYSVTNAGAAQAGTYTVTVTNSAGSVTSSGATLTVNTPAPPPPPPSGGGGGGGGAPSLWFCAVLAALGVGRLVGRRNLRPET